MPFADLVTQPLVELVQSGRDALVAGRLGAHSRVLMRAPRGFKGVAPLR